MTTDLPRQVRAAACRNPQRFHRHCNVGLELQFSCSYQSSVPKSYDPGTVRSCYRVRGICCRSYLATCLSGLNRPRSYGKTTALLDFVDTLDIPAVDARSARQTVTSIALPPTLLLRSPNNSPALDRMPMPPSKILKRGASPSTNL